MTLQEEWEALKTLVLEAEIHVIKNTQGNQSAGVRARKHFTKIAEKAKRLKRISLKLRNTTDE